MMNLKSRQEKILWLTVEETLTQMLVLEAEHDRELGIGRRP